MQMSNKIENREEFAKGLELCTNLLNFFNVHYLGTENLFSQVAATQREGPCKKINIHI